MLRLGVSRSGLKLGALEFRVLGLWVKGSGLRF